MKERAMKLLRELLKNSKRSDRELAKVLGVSQATVSRMRSKLVRDGVIKEFTIIPDFEKLGYELMAITAGRFKTPSSPERIARGTKWAARFPNVIFVSRTQGMSKNAMLISLHKNYTDYNEFFQNTVSEWADAMENVESMLTSLKGVIVKPLSFHYLAEQRAL